MAPAGYIGINNKVLELASGATVRILKIPWMGPHAGDFFFAHGCAGSKFWTRISSTLNSLLQRQLRPNRIENIIIIFLENTAANKSQKVPSIEYGPSAGAFVRGCEEVDFVKRARIGK